MNILIIKLGASGDVVRTTPLLHLFSDEDITWITSVTNAPLIQIPGVRPLTWPQRDMACDRYYDLVINLEDGVQAGVFAVNDVSWSQLFGAYHNGDGMTYTEDSRSWFDMSLISKFGLTEANRLKLNNRYSFQELIYKGLGHQFSEQPYILPEFIPTELSGDVAICPRAGNEWPMKNWSFYHDLETHLSHMGYKVSVLPHRSSILEHCWDVTHHRCLVSGDSFPMHVALGHKQPCVTIFTCTSPWEIYSYGVQEKLVSPFLRKFFYQREYNRAGTTAVPVYDVIDAVVSKIPLHALE